MALKFKLEIECDNAAFADDRTGEIRRILETFAGNIGTIMRCNDLSYGSYPLRDINGNRVGRAWLEGSEDTADKEQPTNAGPKLSLTYLLNPYAIYELNEQGKATGQVHFYCSKPHADYAHANRIGLRDSPAYTIPHREAEYPNQAVCEACGRELPAR